MANPLTAALGYLRGDDLKARVPQTPPLTPKGMGRKLWYYNDWGIGVALRMGTLVHGPGATELLGQAFGNYGQDANSAVFACLAYIGRKFPSAPLRVWRRDPEGGEPDVVPDHPLEELVARPNGHMTGKELWYWTQWAKHTSGNAYWRKLRAGNAETGNVVELWPISPATITPVTTKEDRRRGVFISYYKHEIGPGEFEQIPPEQIVHFKLGIDDYDHRLGCSPLKRLARAVASDDAAEAWVNSLLQNYAIPGLVVTSPDPDMTEEDAEAIKSSLGSKFTGEKRGSVGVLSNGATVAAFGYNPEQMNLRAIHSHQEERICAVFNIPAALVGLGAGLDRSIYNNVSEAREAFVENTILPLYEFDSATLDLQLLPDFASDPRLLTRFDISNLRELQPDEDKKWARVVLAFKEKLITKNEGRADIGFLPVEGGDDFPEPPPQLADSGNSQDNQDGQPQATITEVGATRKSLSTKASRLNVAQLPALFAAMQQLAEPGLTADLRAYFEGQQERVIGALLADVRDPGTANPATARAALPRL